jgi:hypothetical protein
MDIQDSFHSLLDYECLLFHCDWLGSDLRIGQLLSSVVRWLTLHGLTFNNQCYLTDFSFTTQWRLTYDWIGWRLQYDCWMNSRMKSFITTPGDPKRDHYLQQLVYWSIRYHVDVC